jgi:2-succinyl-5-enolpyruvyl-6-hydroxy-3-cyclohexene-1-carboxylate synthase
MNSATANLAWADQFIAALVSAGLQHLVLSPGARSAPLAAAALRRPELACHVINDERAAGYFALGIGKASRQPAAVLCTSGTAAANLLPAIMEANLAGVPLLVLTADRPAEVQGWGANQSVDQIKLYGDQLRAFHALPEPTAAVTGNFLRALATRLLETACSPLPGPVHANLPFREPLLPETLPAAPALPPAIALQPTLPAAAADLANVAPQLAGRPGVIICGEAAYPPGFARAITTLAAQLAAPILAEPLSNLRHGAHNQRGQQHILAHAAHFLRHGQLPEPAWVLRFGAFPVSRVLERWLASLTAAQHFLVAPAGRWPDPPQRADTLLRGDPCAICAALMPHCRPASADFLAAWQMAEAKAAAHSNVAFGPLFEGHVAQALLAALPANAHCFVGNSLAIRALDAFGGTGDKPLTLHGNRGASGIDGNLATAAGIAAATHVPLALLIGDQTLLHDCSSLALLAGRPVVAVVMDNGGGGIFEHLPFARSVPPALLARGWIAAPQVNFAALAQAFGLQYAQATDSGALTASLNQAFAQGGAWLLHVIVERTSSLACF